MILSAMQSLALALAALLPACGACNAMGGGGTAFDEGRAWKDLEYQVGLGPRPPGSEALEQTRVYLEQELSKAGLKPVRDSFEVPAPPEGAKKAAHAFALANVYADLVSKDPKAEMVILCTHFDTKISSERFVGANDGGSGTAVLLELARVLAAAGPRDLTYRFLFLDGEESLRWEWAGDDNTYGSRHAAAELKKSGKAASVRCCILLDMVGDKDLRFWNEAYSNSRLSSIVIDAAASEGLSAHVNGKHEQARDDHLSFMAVGIPSLDLIDFDYGPDNAWWHSKDDTLDKCSAKSLGITGRIVLGSLAGIEHNFARE